MPLEIYKLYDGLGVATVLIALAIMLLAGFALSRLTKLLKLPNVTGYIIAGVLIGPYVLNMIPGEIIDSMSFLSDLALGFIAFGVGRFFKKEVLKNTGVKVIIITCFEALLAGVLVTLAVYLLFPKMGFNFALLLGAIATATAPASTMMTINQYKAKGKIRNENSPVKAVWTTIGICWLLAYLPFITGFVLPLSVGIIILIIMSLGICGFSYIYRFSLYRPMYQVLLGQKFSAINVSIKQITNDTYLKSISSDASITSKKKGYAYFNELFVKRHQKLLWRSAKRITVFALGLLIAAIIALLSFPNTHPQMNKMLLNFLPYFVFIIYSFNSGKSVVQAMFRNCDHSMLTYSFYRRKDVIISLFYLRLRDVICINLMPASIIAIGLPILLYITDKNTDPWIYLIVFICIIATSIFFSIHYLTCYYLLQPYNSMTETKSSTYNVIMSLTYLICFAFIYLRMNAFVFGLIMIAFCVIYIIIASILVYRYASKTFRLRQ